MSHRENLEELVKIGRARRLWQRRCDDSRGRHAWLIAAYRLDADGEVYVVDRGLKLSPWMSTHLQLPRRREQAVTRILSRQVEIVVSCQNDEVHIFTVSPEPRVIHHQRHPVLSDPDATVST